MNIGLFGGSFDPVHMGHVKLIRAAHKTLGLDRTVILPAACSPFKSGSFSTDADRIALCRLSFPKYCTVSDYEIAKGGKSYTVETVRHFRAQYPDARLFLIIGADQLQIFHRWHRFEEILSMATLCAAARTDGEARAQLEACADENLRAYGEVWVMDFDPIPISSTEIRRRVAAGESIRGLVSSAAEKYILEKGLYRDI